MNGAQSLLKALVQAGIDTCFANPGTSEMQLVYEMGLNKDIRPVLCLQENTATGAADGYARMSGKPAMTLLHVGGGISERHRQSAQRRSGRQHGRESRGSERDLSSAEFSGT